MTDNRIVIFFIEQAAQILSNNTEWNTDGRFKNCPKLFTSLLTEVKNRTLPCAYIFFENTTKESYYAAFQKDNLGL